MRKQAGRLQETVIPRRIILRALSTTNRLSFEQMIQSVCVLLWPANVGIGTKSPENTLHVFKGSAGNTTAYYLAPLVVENSTHNYIDLLAPSVSEEGILFGNPVSNASGEIIYNNSSTPSGFQFRVNNSQTKMVLTSDGQLGIGTTTFQQHLLKLQEQQGFFGF